VDDDVSVLGVTGLTAYWGMLDLGQPKAGETGCWCPARPALPVSCGGADRRASKVFDLCAPSSASSGRRREVANGEEGSALLEPQCDRLQELKDVDAGIGQAVPQRGVDVIFCDNVGGGHPRSRV
jgi:NADPH-dependent curcumin reductase CurA